MKYYHSQSCKTWIVKPGENSNRGQGIEVCMKLEEIRAIINKRGSKTYISKIFK